MANQDEFKSILDMGFGAIKERADYALAEIVKNIVDPNTDARKARVLTIQMKITPDSERKNLKVDTTVKTKLEPTNPISTPLYIADDLENGLCAVEMTPQIPGQMSIDGSEQARPGVIKLIEKEA